ncbi:MAG: hypothetical protein HY644_03405 [Acidobacteria bacterium]|nr:hypothetical protein [Acidobacteriota bacterium]
MAKKRTSGKNGRKKVTRYTYEEIKEPRTPETGHTALLPADEQVVTLPMDNGWSKAINIGKLPDRGEQPVVIDMDPAADPVLFWAGKRNKRQIPVLPLQRNEIVSESRIAQIIDRARKAANEKEPQARQGSLFAELEKTPNLKAALKAEIDPEEFKLQVMSQPFPVRGYKRIAVKVVDVYGNESTVVRDLPSAR